MGAVSPPPGQHTWHGAGERDGAGRRTTVCKFLSLTADLRRMILQMAENCHRQTRLFNDFTGRTASSVNCYKDRFLGLVGGRGMVVKSMVSHMADHGPSPGPDSLLSHSFSVKLKSNNNK